MGKIYFSSYSIPIIYAKTTIKDIFSSNQRDMIVGQYRNCISVLPFNQITDEELATDLHKEEININKSVQDKKLEQIIIIDDRDYGTILSDIDPDLNILFNMDSTTSTSSRYYDSCLSDSLFISWFLNINLNANNTGSY